jgi:hypothetical protein
VTLGRRAYSRLWFAATGTSATLAALFSVAGDLREAPSRLEAQWVTVLQALALYTVQANLFVAVTSFLLVRRPERSSSVFAAFLLIALAGIGTTAVVYNALLQETGLDFIAALGSGLAHTVTPLVAIFGWLAFGPIGALSWRLIPLAFLSPLAWAFMMLATGALLGFYPYVFVDAAHLGYPRTTLNLLGLGLLFVALAAAFVWVDMKRLRRQTLRLRETIARRRSGHRPAPPSGVWAGSFGHGRGHSTDQAPRVLNEFGGLAHVRAQHPPEQECAESDRRGRRPWRAAGLTPLQHDPALLRRPAQLDPPAGNGQRPV